MDFDQLHTFLEIVRLKSFSKAAQTCYRTQPAISAQIRQLEQELKAELFERFGSRISLTTAGKIFAEYAERILELALAHLRPAFDMLAPGLRVKFRARMAVRAAYDDHLGPRPPGRQRKAKWDNCAVKRLRLRRRACAEKDERLAVVAVEFEIPRLAVDY